MSWAGFDDRELLLPELRMRDREDPPLHHAKLELTRQKTTRARTRILKCHRFARSQVRSEPPLLQRLSWIAGVSAIGSLPRAKDIGTLGSGFPGGSSHHSRKKWKSLLKHSTVFQLGVQKAKRLWRGHLTLFSHVNLSPPWERSRLSLEQNQKCGCFVWIRSVAFPHELSDRNEI